VNIIIGYSAVDGYRARKAFKSLAGARKYAIDRVGPNPEFGNGYAISDDGVGKIVVLGVSLEALFHDRPPAPPEPRKAQIGDYAVKRLRLGEEQGFGGYSIVADLVPALDLNAALALCKADNGYLDDGDEEFASRVVQLVEFDKWGPRWIEPPVFGPPAPYPDPYSGDLINPRF
jgi:hypothetical protein